MLRLALLVGSLGLSGCFFVFGDDGGDDDCLIAEPAYDPAPLRNPDTLACESFGGGCDPSCGPCPGVAERVAPTPPLPSWNYCGHRCEGLTESACAADAECRVVKDVRCSIWMDCETDFMGCFPTDTVPDQSIDCARTFDAWECSRSSACTAFHYGIGGSARSEPTQLHPFATCMPEGSSPGTCWDPVACDAAPPACPEGTTPGIANLCYTGGCIPVDACEPRPNQ